MDLYEICDTYKDSLVKSLSELIKINSVYGQVQEGAPFGLKNKGALEYVFALCRDFGFKCVNIDGYCGYAQIGEGERLFSILTHLDVVPEGDGWNYPPFEGTVEDGKIIGRGAYDNKGPAIAAIYALKALKDSNIELGARFRIFFGLDEETGFRCIYKYLESEEVPTFSIVPDSYFPVTNCEKGSLSFDLCSNTDKNGDVDTYSGYTITKISGADYPNIISGNCRVELKIPVKSKSEFLNKLMSFERTTGEKVFISSLEISNMGTLVAEEEIFFIAQIYTKGKQCHGSTPEKGKNAVSVMMYFLESLEMRNSTGKLIKFYTGHVANSSFGEGLNIDSNCSKTGRLTLNASKFNQSDNGLSLTFDIRYPISTDAKSIMMNIKEYASNYGLRTDNEKDYKPLYVDENNKYVQILMDTYKDSAKSLESNKELDGNKEDSVLSQSMPISVGFSTYARVLPNAVGFGPYFPDEECVSHDADEAISIDNLLKCSKLFAKALLNLARL